MSNQIRILIADDSAITRGLFEKAFVKNNFEIAGMVSNGRKAVDFCREVKVDAVISDYDMPEMNGVEAANILKDKGIKFKWFLVGDGSEKEKIEHLVETYELQKYIIMPGMQKNPYPYMAACDIYVQPSREEALSISMLESQMLCAPMVSTKTAGGLAMIQEGVNGLLANINAESLADTIEKLIKNDDLRNSIKDYLRSIDYSEEEIRYKNDWKKLLEIKLE